MRFRPQFFAVTVALIGLTNSISASTSTLAEGKAVRFSVAADGTAPFSYQWLKNNVAISGAVGSTYAIDAVSEADAGTYTVLVSNAAGAILSDAAVLNVTAADSAGPPPPPPTATPLAGRLTNLSIRGLAGNASQPLIVGFIVTGTTDMPVLLRGWGPTLAANPFNVSDSLADPMLRVFRDTLEITENNDWGTDPQVAAVAARVGAFPFSPASKDAAVFTRFAPGATTAHVIDALPGSGVILAEIFDANPAATTGSSRLTNLSARAPVGQGSAVLIGGFVIGGETSVRILIRAVGPTLTGFGVNGVLADPQLELHSSTALRETNDNWSDSPNAPAIAALNAQQAFALPANSKDAAILATLPPGVYTSIVRGAAGTTGVVLFELYEVR